MRGTRAGRVAVSLVDGRTVRDLLDNDLLGLLRARGFDVSLHTEAVRTASFAERVAAEGVDLVEMEPATESTGRARAYWMRRRIARVNVAGARAWAAFEQRRFSSPSAADLDALRGARAYLATHAHVWEESRMLAAANELGVPNVGLVRSWDNVHKGIRSRPRMLAVWNEINRREAIDIEGYRRGDVHIVGAPQFDRYFRPDTLWPRAKLAERFDLDPERPIILFATLGQFLRDLDETAWMDDMIEIARTSPREPQIVCRLHPWSRYEYFERFLSSPDVRLSYTTGYIPALGWYMPPDEVTLMANLVAHADVVVTPGSTITLEAAIFDRPTIVPVFHRYQPARAERYFSTWVMGKHFGRIEHLGLTHFSRSPDDLRASVERALAEPDWFAPQRKKLLDDYVPMRDGRATERIADLVAEVAS